ncbi:MAG: DsbA family protein [Terriglobales bacterium]
MTAKQNRLWLVMTFMLAVVCTVALSASASALRDSSVLRPPKGAKVALIVFEDLQCPDCARAHALLEEAARTYKIPLVRYDFPLPMHDWAFEAAVIARYFDTKPKKLGDEFRAAIFKNQQKITKDNLRTFAEQFAQMQKTTLPFACDPQGKLAAAVRADRDLAQRLGLQHTPTIYVVNNSREGTPFVEVVDRGQLFQMIDAMKAEAE